MDVNAHEIRGTNFWDTLHTSSATTTQLKKTKDHKEGMNLRVCRRVYFTAIHTREINASCKRMRLIKNRNQAPDSFSFTKKIPVNKLFLKIWFTSTEEQESGRISLTATRKKKINSTNTLKITVGSWVERYLFEGHEVRYLNKPQEQMQTGFKLIFSFPCQN